MGTQITTLEDDIRSSLQIHQGNDNDLLPDNRQEDEQPGERLPARREDASSRQSLPANREQVEEDEREHPDEEQPEEREIARKTPALSGADKPPVSWRGPVKEEWAKLPVSVKNEIQRREREIAQTLSRTDEERRYAHAIFDAIRPYEHHLRAEKSDHVTAVKNLFEMAHVMRSGTQAQKAELIAELFFRHEVPIKMVDDVLIRRLNGGQNGQPGQAQPGAGDAVRQALQQELAPIREFMSTVQQSRQQSANAAQKTAAQEWNDLLDDPEIGDMVEDVREDIADILELASRRNKVVPLRDAATRAIMAHAEFAPVLQQRQLEKSAQALRDKANKARKAGASLQDDGAPSATDVDESDGSLEADVRSSIQSLGRRR